MKPQDDPPRTIAPALPDAEQRNLVSYLPLKLRPYAQLARLDRPIGWWLLLLPCWWSAALAARMAGQMPDIALLVLFLIGAVAMRGAGSTWNDISDQDLDAKVARTRNRPLPSGQISTKQAFLFLGFQCFIGLCVLLTFNGFAIGMGFLSVLPVLIYPFMKRITSHPQIVLGFAFAWGALMGFAALLSTIPLAGYLLYAGAICWVIGYDTLYALQDIEDDALVGIGSTARAYGKNVHVFIALMYAGAVILAGLAIYFALAGTFAWVGLAAFALHLAWQVTKMQQEDAHLALRLFRSNRNAGLLFFLGLCADATLTFFIP